MSCWYSSISIAALSSRSFLYSIPFHSIHERVTTTYKWTARDIPIELPTCNAHTHVTYLYFILYCTIKTFIYLRCLLTNELTKKNGKLTKNRHRNSKNQALAMKYETQHFISFSFYFYLYSSSWDFLRWKYKQN